MIIVYMKYGYNTRLFICNYITRNKSVIRPMYNDKCLLLSLHNNNIYLLLYETMYSITINKYCYYIQSINISE